VKRLLTSAIAFVLAAAVLAGTGAARGPAGRGVSGALFSAGVSGDSTAAVGQTVISTALSVDPLFEYPRTWASRRR